MADDFQRDMNFADRDTMSSQRYFANPPGQRAPASSIAAMAYSPEQQAPGEDIAGIGHALPIPRAYVPDYVPPAPQPMPPSAGYGGMGAGAVNVIANLLHGFMAGKQIAQVRRDQQANQLASSAWADYARTAAIASNPDLGEAATAAIKLLPKKAQAYQEIVKKYEPQEQPHRGFLAKVGHAVTSGFTTQDPVLFPKGASESPLPTTPVPLSPQQQAQRAQAKNAVAGADVMASHITNEKTVEGIKTQRDQLYGQIQDATKAGDNAKVADLQAQVKQIEQRAAALQQQAVVPGALATQEAQVGAAGDQATLQRRQFANANAALDELNKGTDIWQLSDAQRLSLGINPESAVEAKAYLSLVGQPGGFTNQREAIIAMQMDKAKAMSTMYGINSGRGSLGQIVQAVRGEMPPGTPEPAIYEEALRRYKPDIDEKQKALTPEAFGKARSEISNEVYGTSPELRSLFTNVQTDKKKAPEFILNAGAQPTTHWFWPNEKPEEFAARQNAVREKLWVAGKMHGVNDDQLTQMFGPRPASLGTSAPSGAGVPSAPGASPRPGLPAPPQGAVPTPGAPAAPGASAPPSVNNPMQMWTVTDTKGNSQTVQMTPQEQAQRAADPRYSGFKWQQGGAQSPSATSPGAPAPAAAAPAPVAQPAPAAAVPPAPAAAPAPAPKPAAAPVTQPQAPGATAKPAEKIAYIKSLDPELGAQAEAAIKQLYGVAQNSAKLPPEMRRSPEQTITEINSIIAKYTALAQRKISDLNKAGGVEAEKQAGENRKRQEAQRGAQASKASAAALAGMMAPEQSPPPKAVASKPSSSVARRP